MCQAQLGAGATGASKTGEDALVFTDEETKEQADDMGFLGPQRCQVAGMSDSKPWESSVSQFWS